MKKVVGLHFWEGKAEVCWCDEDSIVTGAIELPVEIRKFSILRNEMAFRKAFETVTDFLSSQAGIDDFDSVLCVPDYFGMKELTTIFKMADEAGISVLKTVTETTAMAMHVLGEYGLTDRIITAFISGRCLGMAEFDLSRGVVDKTDTYVAGIWNNSSLMKTEFAHSYSRRMLDRTDAICVFYAGTMNDCLQFDQVMKVYVQRSEEFINREIEIKMLDSNVLIEGLGFLCGKEEGLPAFREVSFTDIITPYKMTISVNREMYPVYDENARIPFDEEIELRRITEPKGSYTDFLLYEEKESKYEEVCRFRISKEDLEGYYNKLISVMVIVEEDKRMSLILQDKDLGRGIQIPVLDALSGPDIPDDEEVSVDSVIKKMLPIIDNLEYAVKFSQDKDNPYYQGYLQSYNKAVAILADNGVVQISGEGQPFDYNLHNAVASTTDPNLPENTVKTVMQTGYMYKGKVLRTASVVVAN